MLQKLFTFLAGFFTALADRFSGQLQGAAESGGGQGEVVEGGEVAEPDTSLESEQPKPGEGQSIDLPLPVVLTPETNDPPMFNPSIKVYLDPGHHAGIANASPDRSYYEWEGNRAFALEIKKALEAEGIPCLLTITDGETRREKLETSRDFAARLAVVKRDDAGGLQKVFFSIHSDAAGETDADGWKDNAHGYASFIWERAGNRHGCEEAARALIYGLRSEFPDLKDRTHGKGYRFGNYAVLRNADPIPAVLVEVDFHTSRVGLANLTDPVWRGRFVAGFVRGVMALNDVYAKRGL